MAFRSLQPLRMLEALPSPHRNTTRLQSGSPHRGRGQERAPSPHCGTARVHVPSPRRSPTPGLASRRNAAGLYAPSSRVSSSRLQVPRRTRRKASSEGCPLFHVAVDELRLSRLVGSGGFGSVYQAFLSDRLVAVKKLHGCIKNEEASKESFKAELNVAKLRHPHVVEMLGAGGNLDDCFLVMEYTGDRNLLRVINDVTEVLEIDVRLRYASHVASALSFLHNNCVIHLDVKPANVLITPDGVCKLGDFGCCQVVEHNTGRVSPTHRSALTGTFAYRAPELLRGLAPCMKADIYSLGVTLWEMWSRETPYNGENPHVVIFGVVSYNLRPMLTSVFRSSEELDPIEACYQDLFSQCWSTDVEQRPTAADLDDVLKIWVENMV